jgi:hypothetical protein
MTRIPVVVLLTLLLFFSIYAPALADGPSGTLLPGARVDYRFDYRGDGSQIRVALDSSDSQWLTLSIYTPSQAETLRRGGTVDPVGRGTPSRDHDLFWAGGFRAPGVYHVFVGSRANAPILYQLDITGDGVSGAGPVVAVVPTPLPANRVVPDRGQNVLVVNLPRGAGTNALRLPMPNVPTNCTHANQIPTVIAQSIKLCPRETYPPLRVVGSNIGVFADDAHTAVVTSSGRQFAITVEGANNWVEGVTIQARADPQDATAWLCLYDECLFPTQPLTALRGGIRYGGGILLKGSGSTVHGVTVRGGIIGIATVDGRGNAIVDNTLNDLGWGSFNVNSNNSYFVGNILNRNNRACTTPDGRKFLHGCETSGWVCLNCQQNIVATNHCELSANCFYMSGERGMDSNDNKLLANYCSGASDNCFELTFSQRNVLQDNVGTMDSNTYTPCKYPFWVGGSIVFFQNNRWQCSIDPDDAFNQSRDSTIVATNIINLDVAGVPPSALLPPATKAPPAPKQSTPTLQGTALPLGWGAAVAGTAKPN